MEIHKQTPTITSEKYSFKTTFQIKQDLKFVVNELSHYVIFALNITDMNSPIHKKLDEIEKSINELEMSIGEYNQWIHL